MAGIQNFNYYEAMRQASRLDEISGSICKLSNNEFNTVIDNIQGSWHGTAANEYVNKCRLLQDKIKSEASHLSELAGRIREIARIIEEAERAALAAQNNK